VLPLPVLPNPPRTTPLRGAPAGVPMLRVGTPPNGSLA
jgi:hypothetical protein